MERFSYTPESLGNRRKEKRGKPAKPQKPHPLLVARQFQKLLDEGVVNSKPELARKNGLSWARVTQIMNLLKLPREIQKAILRMPEEKKQYFTERKLRDMFALRSVQQQAKAFGLPKSVFAKG